MTKYKITLMYLDAQAVTATVEEDRMAEFFRCLGKGEVFFDKQKKSGVWFPVDKIRFFKLVAEEEEIATAPKAKKSAKVQELPLNEKEEVRDE